MKAYTRNTACRVCGHRELEPFFDLGRQALANSLVKSQRLREGRYPLSLSWCAACNLVQLDHTVDPKILFSKYFWVTGTSQVANDYAERWYEEAARRVPTLKQPKASVLEIASNDGTMLRRFLNHGHTVLGVDPAKNIAAKATKNGIPTATAFFTHRYAQRLTQKRGTADFVMARNVLPHVANTRDFVQGLAACASDSSVVAIEAHDAVIIQEELHYDSIYHEHLCYFTLKSLERLLNDQGLFVFDIADSPISGGSLVLYARKQKTPESPTVKRFRAREGRVNSLGNWRQFAKRAIAHRRELIQMVKSVRRETGHLVGYGASARSSTMLNFCHITNKEIEQIADQNELKQNLYTAGTHIPIKAPEAVFANSNPPKAVLILAWNFADEIITILKQRFLFQGTAIIPLPKLRKVRI
jgi:C-methyltransferase C-terminal domain/Putative zinc binding domain/Methyltransferase domain